MAPEVQIVIPVHKLDRPVLRAVDSVLRCPRAGVIMVAHGLAASDFSLPEDDRITVVEVAEGVGHPGVAFNAGVAAARSRWLGIMGSDDWFEDGALEAMLGRLSDDSADGVLAPLRYDYSDTNEVVPVTRRHRKLQAVRDQLFYRTAPLGLYSRNLLQDARYRFDETAVSGEDMAMSAKLWSDGLSLSYCPTDPAYVVGSDAESRVTTISRSLSEHAGAWMTMWADDQLGDLPLALRQALAEKMFHTNVLPIVSKRRDMSAWEEGDFAWLSSLVRLMNAHAPGFNRGFTKSWQGVYEGLLNGDQEDTLRALTAASYVDNRLPAVPRDVLHRNSWLRKQLRKDASSYTVDSVRDNLKLRVRSVTPRLPAALTQRVIPAGARWQSEDDRQIPRFEHNDKKHLLVGGTNTVGQAKRWADAAATLPEVDAVSLGIRREGTRNFPADVMPSLAAARHSPLWSARTWNEVRDRATHVLVESGAPLLGTLFRRDPRKELIAMGQEGIKVGVVLHGSDIRIPSLHAQLHADSPFQDPLGGLTNSLEESTQRLNRFLNASDIPEFVSTPDLLDYRPDATWLPTLHDRELWGEEELRHKAENLGLIRPHSRPLVVHIPSNSALKGTESIRAALRPLDAEGVLEYRELVDLTPEEVALEVACADIVIDQVSMGLYGVASVEAMALGKPVVAQVGETTRKRILEITGCPVPIVEASPATLTDTLRRLAVDEGERLRLGNAGREYVQEVHSQSRVGEILEVALLRK